MNPSTAPVVLLLITDNRAVYEHAVHLRGEVVRVPHVGGARRWLAEQEFAGSERVSMVAWGPDVIASADFHWRLDGPAVEGVAQVALRVPGATALASYGFHALGLDRCVVLPGGLDVLNAEVWGVGAQAA